MRTTRHHQLAGFRFSLKHFPGEGAPVWGDAIPARVCVLVQGGMSENGPGSRRRFGPADVVYHPSGARPRIRFGPDGVRTVTLEVTPKRLHSLKQSGAVVEKAIAFCSGKCTGLACQLSRELSRPDGPAPLALEGLALQLLSQVFENREREKRIPPPWLAGVRRRVKSDFRTRLGTALLASEARVHPVHLSRAFRRNYGESVCGSIKRLRIDYAARRLLESEATLAEIALDSGFYDQSHFANCFKEVTGQTPAMFRRVLGGLDGLDVAPLKP